MAALAFDPASDTWRLVQAELDALDRIALAAVRSPLTGERDTQFHRGVLSAVAAVRALARPPVPEPANTAELY